MFVRVQQLNSIIPVRTGPRCNGSHDFVYNETNSTLTFESNAIIEELIGNTSCGWWFSVSRNLPLSRAMKRAFNCSINWIIFSKNELWNLCNNSIETAINFITIRWCQTVGSLFEMTCELIVRPMDANSSSPLRRSVRNGNTGHGQQL